MPKLNASSIVRVIEFTSLVLAFGLLDLATVAQGGVEGRHAPNPEPPDSSPNDQGSNGTTRGDVITCNDDNVCTDDFIDPFDVCFHTNNSSSCDDDLYCNGPDTCSDGTCSVHAGNPCPGPDGDGNCAESCDEVSDSCTAPDPNGSPCDDGQHCNGSDFCGSGTCSSHVGNPCPSNGSCDEVTHNCGPGIRNSMISFKAVKRNNVPIAPGTCNLALVPPRCSTGNVNKLCASNAECHVGTNNLTVRGNDTIEVEFFLSGWADELASGVRFFGVKLDVTGLVSSDNGVALPVGWCAPMEAIDCTDSSTCPPTYPICAPPSGCTCAGYNPNLGAFISRSRTDYLFSAPGGIDTIDAIDTSSLNFRYNGLAIDSIGVLDSGVVRYLGSLILKVSANACGQFPIGFVEEISRTFIGDPGNPPKYALPASQPLLLTVSDCPRQLLSCNPGHCSHDARIAHDRLDFQTKFNINTIEMSFSKPTTGMTAADFEITLVPTVPGDVLPGLLSVTPVVGNPNNATVVLNRRIPQTRWTCIRDRESNKHCCMGSLPGDADSNRTSSYTDVSEIMHNLDGLIVPRLPLEKCDTDRSLRCLPADLLMVVDLLTGADAVPEPGVNGNFLEVCGPSMRLPP